MLQASFQVVTILLRQLLTVNIEYLEPYHASPAHLGQRDAPTNPDPVLTADGGDEYEVDRILTHRYNAKDGFSYLVSWKGYDDATWEPETNLQNARDAIDQYIRSTNIDDRSADGFRRSGRASRR